MASPTRTPSPPPAVEPIAPSLSSEHPPVNPSCDGSFSPENPAPAPPPPPATPHPHTPGDSSPSSIPHPSAPQPLPSPPPHTPDDSSPSSTPHPSAPQPPPSPPPPSADVSPPLSRQGETSPRRPLPPPSPAPVSPPTPAPASSEAKSEQEEAESASESGSMTLAIVLAKTEDATPPKASSAEASPTRSPQKESAVTIAKLLSAEDLAAMEAKATPDKVTPPSDAGSLAAAVTTVGGVSGGVGSKRWLLGGVPEKVRRAELRRAELGFRVSAAVFCLVALSVMAADTTTGWSGDSFRRYNEYRYVLAASVVTFTYCGFQLVAEVHYVVTGRHMIRAPFRSYFNLAMDQMLAYLLLSASSAALSRNGVWMSRFGGDQFTKLINVSASMAFLAFIALGLNSVISAYCFFSLVS
uniref:CASP-like protein n=1 Tax=Zea mays TaxID=4577 RepID=B6TF17_MAIZE|nr:hypothetical protein [Zea mays]